MKNKLKSDRYRSVRGGYARVLTLHCRLCNSLVVKYQKDGPGSLYRLYFDRIISPKELVGCEYREFKNIKPLCCPGCREILAIPYIYKPEKRKSFRLFCGALVKKK